MTACNSAHAVSHCAILPKKASRSQERKRNQDSEHVSGTHAALPHEVRCSQIGDMCSTRSLHQEERVSGAIRPLRERLHYACKAKMQRLDFKRSHWWSKMCSMIHFLGVPGLPFHLKTSDENGEVHFKCLPSQFLCDSSLQLTVTF